MYQKRVQKTDNINPEITAQKIQPKKQEKHA